jgi:hypothetical protein
VRVCGDRGAEGCSAMHSILTFPTSLMRKGVDLRQFAVKAAARRSGQDTAIRATQGALIAASFEGVSLPPVLVSTHTSGEGSGRQNARTDIPPRRPYNDAASLPEDRNPRDAGRC